MMVFITKNILDADDNTIQFAPRRWIVLFLIKGLGPFQRLCLKYLNKGIQVMLACDLCKVRGGDVCAVQFAA